MHISFPTSKITGKIRKQLRLFTNIKIIFQNIQSSHIENKKSSVLLSYLNLLPSISWLSSITMSRYEFNLEFPPKNNIFIILNLFYGLLCMHRQDIGYWCSMPILNNILQN